MQQNIKGTRKGSLINTLPLSGSKTLIGRRRFPLTFLPPSTKSPLFVYNNEYDQRSFLSLGSGHENNNNGENSDGASSFRSLPSTVDVSEAEVESIREWLEEERERRSLLDIQSEDEFYGSILNEPISKFDNKSVKSRRNSKSSFFSVEHVIQEEQNEDYTIEPSTETEIKILLSYTIPLIFTFFLEQIFSLVSVVFVGHLGKEELAAVSLASMTSTIILAIFEGIATALDTLCPQAYGSGNLLHVGIHTQRCCIFSFVLFIPAALFWWFSGLILSLILKDNHVVELTQKFLRIFILAGPPYILFENGKRFLQAQGIFDAGTYILFITAPLNVFLNWALVYSESFGMGFIGAPIASVINFWLMFILLVLYIVYIDGLKCWGGFTFAAFFQWWDLSLLAIPGIIMLLAESLAYEILTLLASYFGTSALATQSALSSVVSLLYMIPFALSVASSTRVANFIGAQNEKSAKKSIFVSIGLATIASVFNFLIILIGTETNLLGRLFTEDLQVLKMFNSLSWLISLFVFIDAIACVMSGLLRALGLQMIGGWINLIGYYCFGVPLSCWLAFSGFELWGLWIGNWLGLLLILLSEAYVVRKANWDQILKSARQRIDNNN
ncbi:hypothetical protein DAMA08_042720 [Martiniozyma asiatica (nom. inval.)]|nr:hypothetical protein DAMA08_027030 [Martiniozyma asiatica]GMM31527.1 hypothetical protein DAMA08_042720 [Martiniozyma asiatica]